MGLKNDLDVQVTSYLTGQWNMRTMRNVPEPGQVGLRHDGVQLDATVLYADMVGSSDIVKKYPPTFAASVYKAYLNTACRILKSQGGTITAFDGDRVMAVFIGENKEAKAVTAAFQINSAVIEIINPALSKYVPQGFAPFKIGHCIGIDSSPILVAATGLKGDNDLVWVGNAANKAAKLCSERGGNATTYITPAVFNALPDYLKFSKGETLAGLLPSALWDKVIRGADFLVMSVDYGSTAHMKFS